MLEEKFNDLLTPILGYAEFLQMQLGPESELYQDAREIELAAGQLQAQFQEISSHHRPGQFPASKRQWRERIKAMGWGDENAMERKKSVSFETVTSECASQAGLGLSVPACASIRRKMMFFSVLRRGMIFCRKGAERDEIQMGENGQDADCSSAGRPAERPAVCGL